jgi:geranylgeranyl pyrophosphate synthase
MKLLGKNSIKRAEIKKAIQLYRNYGSTDYAKSRAEFFLQKALESLDALKPTEARDKLALVAKFLVSRSY